MPGRQARMVQRVRSELDLQVLHIEISRESYQLLKELAAAKKVPMGGYVDRMLQKKRERLVELGFIQKVDSAI